MALPSAQTALTAGGITQLGFVALQTSLQNTPIEQVAVQPHLLQPLMAKKKPGGGGTENVVQQSRRDDDDDF